MSVHWHERDGYFRTVSTRARARLNGNLELSRRIISFVTHDEQKSLRCMRSYGCVRVSLPLRPDDRVGHADAQNGLTFTGTARRRFSPLSASSSVLDALWIVAIILEQPAYALVVPSRPIRFWLLILSLQVLPQNKIKLISSEEKLPQLFDFIW